MKPHHIILATAGTVLAVAFGAAPSTAGPSAEVRELRRVVKAVQDQTRASYTQARFIERQTDAIDAQTKVLKAFCAAATERTPIACF